MSSYFKFFRLPKKWVLVSLFLGASGWYGEGWALSEPASIDSLKKQIGQLVLDKKYGQAAKSYESLGWLYHQHYGYNKYTMDAYFNGLKYYSLTGDSAGYYNEHIVIGDYYTHDYFMQPYAEKYLTKARQYFERTKNIPKVIECRLGLADIAQQKNPIPKGLLTELRETEQMSVRYKQAYSQAFALNLLANTYSRIKQPDSAQYFAIRSLAIAERLNVKWLISLNHFYLGIVEQFRNHSKEALAAYDKSYQLAELENNLSMLRELSKHKADSYSRVGDYKNAYSASLKAQDFITQFYTSEQTKSIRLQELDSQIKTLAVEKQLVEEQSHNQHVLNSMLAIGLLISVLGVGALIFLRRQQKLIAHQETVIARQQIRQLELKSLRAMIEGQEGERSRIARDLHDGLGIQLSRIKLFVEAHQEQLPLSVKEPLNQFLDEACTETRLISNNLRPYALSTFGLMPALEDLVQKLNLVNQTKLILEHYGEVPALDDESSVMLYRVVQELLNNALKHANAQTVTVQLMASDETTLISVDDDGRGADFDNMMSRGNGIANIKSRIAYLGGQVMWQSEIGKGTSVMISLPIKKQTPTIPAIA
ncbi:sensor histidine kinase [Spirosoma pollinicola]|uniref:Oxygen sensor histidine kinase NreB n=1 Tax=Spirosoma pollinicola TaxID=2057025 RepID=A0A2K8ZC75_9BACT|nr:sensor histidine kinase [Spirosoma pollinicola]AUD07462.1 histidine kinase [Spirosoma pollinicola]